MTIEVPTPIRDAYRNRCVLVTGAAGAIGSHLTRAIADLGASRLVALDDLSQGVSWNIPRGQSIVFIEGSVDDAPTLSHAFSHRPWLVFHLASVFANQKSIDDPRTDLLTNGLGTLLVLEHARQVGARVVFTSTSCTLNPKTELPADEGMSPVRVDTPYQITKALGEQYCRYFGERHRLEVVRFRLFNSYGPGDLPGRYRSAIPNFFSLAMRGEPLPILGTGGETRDWTFVGDVVHGLVRAGASADAAGHVVHLGTGRETTVLAVAKEINCLTGNDAGVVFRQPRSWDRQPRRRASTGLARELLGFEALTTLEQGLRLTAQWFAANWHRIRAMDRQ